MLSSCGCDPSEGYNSHLLRVLDAALHLHCHCVWPMTKTMLLSFGCDLFFSAYCLRPHTLETLHMIAWLHSLSTAFFVRCYSVFIAPRLAPWAHFVEHQGSVWIVCGTPNWRHTYCPCG